MHFPIGNATIWKSCVNQLLNESCMKVGSLWKWESSPGAGKATAHDNQRKKEMGPTQKKWGKEEPGRTMMLSPSLRIDAAAVHGILIVSKQPGAM